MSTEENTQQPPAATVNAGLDDETSAELGRLLDEQQARLKRKDRNNRLLTLAVLVALTAGGGGWFVSSPDRIAALDRAFGDIRSVSEISAMLANYQVALDQIAVRGDQINEATASLGAATEIGPDEDAYMSREMEAFTGGDASAASRNEAFVKKFGTVFPPAEAQY